MDSSRRPRARAGSGQKKVPRLKPRIQPQRRPAHQGKASGFGLSFAVVTLLMCSLAIWFYFSGHSVSIKKSSSLTFVPKVPAYLPPPLIHPELTLRAPLQTDKEITFERLQAEVAQERGQEVIRPWPQPSTKSKPELIPIILPIPSPSASTASLPVSSVDLPGADNLTSSQVAAYQAVLERRHFSCGFIDGDLGPRSQRMLRAFQQSHALPVTGKLDARTRQTIGEPEDVWETYTVSAEDLAAIMPKPQGWRAKSQVSFLGYNDLWELLGEKFHCSRSYLKGLNPNLTTLEEGTEIKAPKITPEETVPQAAFLRISLTDTSIEALDSSGQVLAFFPCSIAADKNKRPNGILKVISVVPHPDYTFDPELFKEAAVKEGIHDKLTLPPGPRNPVGTAWVGLSLPGYGIHGTPEPENISRTQSHGCFRLANWNAETVLAMVKVGTPVEVVP